MLRSNACVNVVVVDFLREMEKRVKEEQRHEKWRQIRKSCPPELHQVIASFMSGEVPPQRALLHVIVWHQKHTIKFLHCAHDQAILPADQSEAYKFWKNLCEVFARAVECLTKHYPQWATRRPKAPALLWVFRNSDC